VAVHITVERHRASLPTIRECRFSREGGNGIAARFGDEDIAEVGVERAALQPAGLVDREQPFDRSFAALRAA
jgi:hypothetical protein